MLPVWYWIVAGILLLWNLVGCFACYSQLTINEDKFAKLPAAQRESWLAMPRPAKAAYVIAVGAGLAGAILLLLQSAMAGPAFILSLIGICVQFGWFFFIYRGMAKLGVASAAFPAFILLVAIIEIGFACIAKTAGWLA